MTVSIWRVPVYLSYLQPPLTAAAIGDAEARLGVTLPAAYLDLLREQNGGYVRVRLADTVFDEIWGIGPHFPNILDEHWWRDDGASSGGAWLPVDPKLLVPFAGDGHWHMCLDYRQHGPQGIPGVMHLDLETEQEQPVASSFGAFLQTLTLDIEPGMLGIVGDEPLASIVARLSTALGVAVAIVDAEWSGYPLHRWPLGGGSSPEWAWLSPNRVPRGFARPSEPRYAELVGLLPGTALRYPEFPECALLLTCTDGVNDRVAAACVRAGLTVRHLG